MTGYVRKDTTNNIADGNVINAADLDSEFDGVQAAFNSSTGHTHDGSSAEGAPITKLGPVQDVTVSTTVLGVKTTNTVDLGTSSLKFKDFYLAGNASIGGTLTYGGVTLSNAVTGTGSMVLSASPTITGTITAAAANFSGAVAFNGTTTIGDADTDTITQAASYVTGTQLKSAKTATNTWSLAAYDVDGTAYTNLITLTASNTPTLALTSTGVGSMDNIAIGATTASTGAFTTLSANSTVTLSGGTANGVAYLNGSKVLTTGSALTFDGTNLGVGLASPGCKVDVLAASNTSLSPTVRVYSNNLAVNTAISYDGIQGSGDFYIGSTSNSPVIFKQSNTEQMRLTSTSLYTASGINVGIGTSSPLAKLNVSGGTTIASLAEWNSKANTVFTLANAAVRLGVGYDANDQPLIQGFDSTNGARPIGLQVYGGNLGLGTSSPGNKLTVKPSATSSGTLDVLTGSTNTDSVRISGGGTVNTWLEMRGYLGVKLYSDATNTVTVDSSGNLGLGVTPSAWTSVFKAAQVKQGSISTDSSNNTTFANNCYFDGSNWKYINTAASQQYLQYAGQHIWTTAPSGTGGVTPDTVSFTQAMTLDSSGNLGIAQTDPTNNGVSGYNNLVIGNSSSSTCGLTFKTVSTGTPLPGIAWSRGAGSGVNGKVYYDQSTDRLYCQAGGSGGVYLAGGGTSWTSASDERVKDIIEPIDNATQKLANWRTVIGKYKSDTDGVRRSFLIAQDVLTTFPEAVNTDKAEEYGLNYQDLIPLLVASIQELKAEFDAYKASHP